VTKLQEAAQDGVFVGYTLKKAAVGAALVGMALAIIVLSLANIMIQHNTAKLATKLAIVGTDRWTATDQADYQRRHAEEVAAIVAEEKRAQAKINKELLEGLHAIREELAGDRVQLDNIEDKVDRIERKVFNGYPEGG
jgi:hypothetical protein